MKPTSLPPRLARFVAGLAFLLSGLATAATVSIVTGGDPDEGLDLQGNFLYAVNVGPNGAVGKVGDADFTGDNVTGVTVAASDQIDPWGTLDFGDTANDNTLEKVFLSIRHMFTSPEPWRLAVTLQGLEPGADYKLQLLFREQGWNRAFDIVIDSTLILDDFNPGIEQGGIEQNTVAGCVVTHDFTAAGNAVSILLDGGDVSLDDTDHNPILSGITLERLSAVSDNDNDGLPDDWEQKYFGNTTQEGTDDPDQDTLTNATEFGLSTDPTKKDTDGDTLTDDAEVNTTHTSPAKADTDGDGIRDDAELASTHTDPLKADTDGDTFSDYDELRMITDPLNADSYPKKTTFSPFTGGDEGEGLDLDGNFLYAINVGPPDAVGQIRDALFTEDVVEGVTISGGFIAGNWHTGVSFGDTINDEILELLMASIRWSNAVDPLTPVLRLSFANLEAGAAYKLQLLFAEEAWNRGFDVTVDGRFIADDFSPWHYQGGFPKTNGVVLAHNFIASSAAVDIILDGRTVVLPEFTDHNPILQGATLELMAPNRDSDGDGLPDPWEIDQFNNLGQTASGDPDGDALTNAHEFAAGTDPRKADTDGDGLADGVELNTTLTNPLKRDTDADGLSDKDEVDVYHSNPTQTDSDGDALADGFEVNTLHTDPAKPDSDGDATGDYDELRVMTDPTDPASRPSSFPISVFTGGDEGEGLDLDGNFVYAINIGPPDAAGQIRDALFTEDTVEGVTILGGNIAGGWHDPSFGETEPDLILALIMASIRWSDAASPTQPSLVLALANLEPGTRYKLQLLFAEHGWPRGFDVFIDGGQFLNDFSPAHYQGGYDKTKGVVVTHTFIAQTTSVQIVLDGRSVTSPEMTDHNALIDGATLENLGLAPVAPQITAVAPHETGVRVTFSSVVGQTYALEHMVKLDDPSWQEVPGATAATAASTTLTDTVTAHRTAPQGFWRVVVK